MQGGWEKRAITNRTGVVGLEEATGSPLIASIMLTTASLVIGTQNNDREKCNMLFSGGDRLSVFLAYIRVDDKDITLKIMRTEATGSPCPSHFCCVFKCAHTLHAVVSVLFFFLN